MNHEHFIVSLLQLPGVGRKTAWKVVKSSSTIPESGEQLFDKVQGITRATLDDAKNAWTEAGRILEDASSHDMKVLSATNPEFPQQLKSIPDPPLVLFIKGDASCLKSGFGVAVIGTREPSEFGKKVAHRFGQRGAEAGCVVISGLAIGCDSEAHQGCLDGHGKTIAVLAHGLDRVYPKASQPLADEILVRGGCWVSEYAPGVRAQRSHFIERDRLQSGLASGVIVVETDTEGGTMHTVRFAETQGRPLAALSHPEKHSHEEKARGNIMLIQERRATPLKEANDFSSFMTVVRQNARHWYSVNEPAIEQTPSQAQKEIPWELE